MKSRNEFQENSKDSAAIVRHGERTEGSSNAMQEVHADLFAFERSLLLKGSPTLLRQSDSEIPFSAAPAQSTFQPASTVAAEPTTEQCLMRSNERTESNLFDYLSALGKTRQGSSGSNAVESTRQLPNLQVVQTSCDNTQDSGSSRTPWANAAPEPAQFVEAKRSEAAQFKPKQFDSTEGTPYFQSENTHEASQPSSEQCEMRSNVRTDKSMFDYLSAIDKTRQETAPSRDQLPTVQVVQTSCDNRNSSNPVVNPLANAPMPAQFVEANRTAASQGDVPEARFAPTSLVPNFASPLSISNNVAMAGLRDDARVIQGLPESVQSPARMGQTERIPTALAENRVLEAPVPGQEQRVANAPGRVQKEPEASVMNSLSSQAEKAVPNLHFMEARSGISIDRSNTLPQVIEPAVDRKSSAFVPPALPLDIDASSAERKLRMSEAAPLNQVSPPLMQTVTSKIEAGVTRAGWTSENAIQQTVPGSTNYVDGAVAKPEAVTLLPVTMQQSGISLDRFARVSSEVVSAANSGMPITRLVETKNSQIEPVVSMVIPANVTPNVQTSIIRTVKTESDDQLNQSPNMSLTGKEQVKTVQTNSPLIETRVGGLDAAINVGRRFEPMTGQTISGNSASTAFPTVKPVGDTISNTVSNQLGVEPLAVRMTVAGMGEHETGESGKESSIDRMIVSTKTPERRYLTGVEVAFAITLASAGIYKSRHSEQEFLCLEGNPMQEVEEDESGDDDRQDEEGTFTPSKRPTFVIAYNDSLVEIAERFFGNADVAWLIADINAGRITETREDDKRIVELRTRQEIELPFHFEVKKFLESKGKECLSAKLVTIILVSEIDRELLNAYLADVLGTDVGKKAEECKMEQAPASSLPVIDIVTQPLLNIVEFTRMAGQSLMPSLRALAKNGVNLATHIQQAPRYPVR